MSDSSKAAMQIEAQGNHFAEHASLREDVLEAGAQGAYHLPHESPLSLEQCMAWVEDPTRSLDERLLAGSILGLIGDPRTLTGKSSVAIPGGTYEVGLDVESVDAVVRSWQHVGVEPSWIAKEVPAHVVTLDDFWMAKYPVTNEEYWRFLRATNGIERPSTWYLGAYPWHMANHPVAGVSIESATEFTAWASTSTGHPWRLPTEAEWEVCAGGGRGYEYPWGNLFEVGRANTRELGIHTTTPVGCFPGGASRHGVLDMAGNVEEYVSSTFRPYPGGTPSIDDLSTKLGTYNICRGGSFSRYGDLLRTRRRHGAYPSPLYPIGLRLATSMEPE